MINELSYVIYTNLFLTHFQITMAEKTPVRDVEEFSTDKLISFLERWNFKLSKDHIAALRNKMITGSDFLQLTREIPSTEPFNFHNEKLVTILTLIQDLNRQSRF